MGQYVVVKIPASDLNQAWHLMYTLAGFLRELHARHYLDGEIEPQLLDESEGA